MSCKIQTLRCLKVLVAYVKLYLLLNSNIWCLMPKLTQNDFWNRVDKTESCWIWKGRTDRQGYGWFRWDYRDQKSHRLSYQWAKGSIPQGQFVCHSCDNPSCVNPDHLWIGSLQDNHRDMMNKGRHGYGVMKGSKNASAKLTEAQVLEIRATPGPNWRIAEKYGVSKCTIDEIKTRTTWRHI